jgi:hypothetical protein
VFFQRANLDKVGHSAAPGGGAVRRQGSFTNIYLYPHKAFI